MVRRFEIVGSGAPRPQAERILFCDGTGGELYRAETDLELSHWRPNRTPAAFRAGTSTEICFRFLDHPQPGDWTVAVNNHVDVDGILSVYVLVHSEHARTHRETLCQAADLGDFWGWGEPAAQRVFQGLALLMSSGLDAAAIYHEAFRRIPGLIDGRDPQSADLDASLEPLRRGVDWVESGRILRRQIAPRLAHYIVPREIAGDDDDRASYVPEFNEAISEKGILWPQVRARRDAERACLVSVERRSGWFHELFFPGYLWADVEGKWQPAGFVFHDGMQSYSLENDQLQRAFATLQTRETTAGAWTLGGTTFPFETDVQKRFPAVGRFLDLRRGPAPSSQRPEHVAAALGKVFFS